ncbi:hypothetical protein BRC81_12835 [Halobacteriales archaeon QS_1_68_20]|nr:MAG: hypothetical protein BRC81_12835 [Halobacteriales archaeon QS_1_68_20]
MPPDTFWQDLRKVVERLQPGSELVTPVSERSFRVVAAFGDRFVVRFADSDEERSLWREQFEVVADRLDDETIGLADLAPGVEPYAAVLSLSPDYEADEGSLARSEDASEGESPFRRSPSEARTRPERIHDDAMLLADVLGKVDATGPESLSTERLTDLYVLLSDVQRGAGRLRRDVGDPLLQRMGPGQRLHGRFGTVTRTTRERRRPKDDEAVLDALDDHGVPHEWVLGVDPDKLDVVVAVTDVDESEVFEVDEQVYPQKTGVDEDEKYSRLQGLVDRLEELDEEKGRRIREEVEDVERRLEELLSAG